MRALIGLRPGCTEHNSQIYRRPTPDKLHSFTFKHCIESWKVFELLLWRKHIFASMRPCVADIVVLRPGCLLCCGQLLRCQGHQGDERHHAASCHQRSCCVHLDHYFGTVLGTFRVQVRLTDVRSNGLVSGSLGGSGHPRRHRLRHQFPSSLTYFL